MAAKKAAKKSTPRKKAVRKRPAAPKARGGRPKGSKNKIPKTLAEKIIRATEAAGNITVQRMKQEAELAERELTPTEIALAKEEGEVAYLTHLALTNSKSFGALLAKMMPTNVNLSLEENTMALVEEALRIKRGAQKELDGMRIANPVDVTAKSKRVS